MNQVTARVSGKIASNFDLTASLVTPQDLGSKTTKDKAAKGGTKSSIVRELSKGFKVNLASVLKDLGFQAKSLESCAVNLPRAGKLLGLTLVGAPEPGCARFDLINYCRKFGASLFEQAKRSKAKKIQIVGASKEMFEQAPLTALLNGFQLASYSFASYKSKQSKASETQFSLTFVTNERKLKIPSSESKHLSQATSLARDLINTPARDCTPEFLVQHAKSLAKEGKLRFEVFNRKALKKIGANCLLAVAQGSALEPFLVKLTYRPPGKASKIISLAGKGITFDSGGLCIKNPGGMENMKVDMSGAAAVLGAMKFISWLKPQVEVRAYIPTCENMISGEAMRPGDVIKALNGKTIEVLNTDAEGRLILADALSLAVKEKCNVVIDIATLTGACMVALGTGYAGLFTNDDQLAADIIAAGETESERFWRLPLPDDYKELIKGSVADIKNTGGPFGGAITAALFLQEFVGKTKWAHLDIAPTAGSDGDKGYLKKGGVGFGVRTLGRYVAEYANAIHATE